MPRRFKDPKPYIVVFCEGESEQAYTDFLKKEFKDVVSIKRPSSTGLFEEADRRFEKDKSYRDYTDVTDEIWFFFDVDEEQTGSWEKNKKIISTLKRLRKKPNIRIRLLMTTGCIEYWFLLHYKKTNPSIQSPAEKEKVLENLKKYCSNYAKGDSRAIREIGGNLNNAVENGKWVLHNLEGLPMTDDEDIRNRWLYQSSLTFTTVHEAIEFLEGLQQ